MFGSLLAGWFFKNSKRSQWLPLAWAPGGILEMNFLHFSSNRKLNMGSIFPYKYQRENNECDGECWRERSLERNLALSYRFSRRTIFRCADSSVHRSEFVFVMCSLGQSRYLVESVLQTDSISASPHQQTALGNPLGVWESLAISFYSSAEIN